MDQKSPSVFSSAHKKKKIVPAEFQDDYILGISTIYDSKQMNQGIYFQKFKYAFVHVFTVLNLYGIPSNLDVDKSSLKVNGLPKVLTIVATIFYLIFYIIDVFANVSFLMDKTEAKEVFIFAPIAFIEVFGLILMVLVWRKRKYISNMIWNFSKILSQCPKILTKEDRNRLRTFATGLCAFSFFTHILLPIVRGWYEGRMESSKTSFLARYLYGYEIPNNFAFQLVTQIFCQALQRKYAILDIFIIFYCMCCWILKKASLYFTELTEKNEEFGTMMLTHNKFVRLAEEFDSAFSLEIFWCCSIFYTFLFSEVYVIVTGKLAAKTAFDHFTCIYLFTVFVFLVLSATFFTEAESNLQETVKLLSSEKKDMAYSRLNLQLSTTVVELTIGKITPIERSTILSVLGALFSYGFIIASFQ